MRLPLCIGALLAFAVAVRADSPDRVARLSDAVRRAVQRHPVLQAAGAAVREAQAARGETASGRYPRLSGATRYTYSDHPVTVFSNLLQQERFTSENFAISSLNDPAYLGNFKSTLELSVPVFSANRTTSRMRQQALDVRGAQQDMVRRAQETRLLAALAYGDVLAAAEKIGALDSRIRSGEQAVTDAKKLQGRGLVLGSDFFAAEAILSGLRARQLEAQHVRSSAMARLRILSGADIGEPAGGLGDRAPEVPSLDDMQGIARTHRPEIPAASARLQARAIERGQVERFWWPDVAAFGALETDTENFKSNPVHHLVGVTAVLPFGDPSLPARRLKAEASEAEALAWEQNELQQIRGEVSSAWHDFELSRQMLPIAREMTAQTAESRRLAWPLYQSGRQSILDVLKAEDALASAQAQLIEARLRMYAAYLALERAAGRLDEERIGSLERLMKPPV